MQDRQREERRNFLLRFRPFPSYEDWLRAELSPEAADQWRYRDHEPDEIPARIVGDVRIDPVETRRRKDLRDFVAEIHGDRVAYTWSAGCRRRSSIAATASTCTPPATMPPFWLPCSSVLKNGKHSR